MKHLIYSHEGGEAAVPPFVQQEVVAAISAVGIKPAKGATTKVRDAFLKGIQESGWPAEVQLSKDSKMTVTSTKEEIGLCLQTGNMGRMYADLLKLQTMYLNKAIKAAIVVVPSRPVAKVLGDNIANAHRLVRELEIFKLAYSVPTLVFSLE